jgi:hypothetical protein
VHTSSVHRVPLDQGLPGLFEEILTCADTFFAQELPAVQQWSFVETDARDERCGRRHDDRVVAEMTA